MARWDLLETFVHVVEAGSFSAAARKLNVSKSLVSKKVSQLEENLGTQLLFRTTRQINPTDAGQTLFLKCEKLFSSLEEAEQSVLNMKMAPKGQLRIACTDVFGEKYIAKAAAIFCKLYPDVKIDVHITMRIVDPVEEGYDMAIRYGQLSDSSLKARKIFELPHVACASPAYIEKNGKPETVDQLSQHSCLAATFAPCSSWRFTEDGKNIDVKLESDWRSNNGSALITAARQAIGICWLPELYVRKYIDRGELIPLLQNYEAEPLSVWIVYPNTRYVSTKVRMFIDYLSENLQSLTAS